MPLAAFSNKYRSYVRTKHARHIALPCEVFTQWVRKLARNTPRPNRQRTFTCSWVRRVYIFICMHMQLHQVRTGMPKQQSAQLDSGGPDQDFFDYGLTNRQSFFQYYPYMVNNLIFSTTLGISMLQLIGAYIWYIVDLVTFSLDVDSRQATKRCC